MASGRILSSDDTVIEDCGTGKLVELHTPGERVELMLGGGAGYGDPSERDAALIERDLRLGYVTRDYVRRFHPSALTATQELAATA